MIAFATAERVYLIHESDLAKFMIGSWYHLYRRGVRWDTRSVRVDAVYKRTAPAKVTDPDRLSEVIQRGDELRRIER